MNQYVYLSIAVGIWCGDEAVCNRVESAFGAAAWRILKIQSQAGCLNVADVDIDFIVAIEFKQLSAFRCGTNSRVRVLNFDSPLSCREPGDPTRAFRILDLLSRFRFDFDT